MVINKESLRGVGFSFVFIGKKMLGAYAGKKMWEVSLWKDGRIEDFILYTDGNNLRGLTLEKIVDLILVNGVTNKDSYEDYCDKCGYKQNRKSKIIYEDNILNIEKLIHIIG